MKKIYCLLFSVLFFIHAHAQITTKEPPVSFYTENTEVFIRETVEIKTMSPVDMESIRQEDEENEQKGMPPRFGYSIKAGFDLNNSGTWTDLPNGDKVWRLSISCPGALSVNLLYDKFWLPDGAKLFVYSNDKKQSTGAKHPTTIKAQKKI